MSSKSKPKSLGIVAVGVLLLGGGATYYQYNAVQGKKAEVAALESEVPSQEELLKSLADSSQKVSEYRTRLEHLEAAVPDVAYIPTLMQELEQIGLGHNIKVIGVRPAPMNVMAQAAGPKEGDQRPKKKPYEEIEIEVQGRGTYDNVKAFLESLKTFPKIIAVKTVTMEPQRDLGQNFSRQIEAKVNVVAYVFPFEFIPAAPERGATKTPNAQAQPQTGQTGAQKPPVTQSAPPQGGGAAATNLTETMKVSRKGGQ